MLTGEYVVLDGAQALAMPCKLGQSLRYTPKTSNLLHWTSYDADGRIWFSTVFNVSETAILCEHNDEKSEVLLKLLQVCRKKNPHFLKMGGSVTTHLEFPKEYGLGSSSTLIANLATWAKISPYELLWEGFTGSGYDIACAINNQPILYKLLNQNPTVTPITLNYPFTQHLFFVHLNKKQNSREGIARYRSTGVVDKTILDEISALSLTISKAQNLDRFEQALTRHEKLISSIINSPTIKQTHFTQFKGAIKSLGAWGGDFILATGKPDYVLPYFKEKG